VCECTARREKGIQHQRVTSNNLVQYNKPKTTAIPLLD
jgi:hypothetical protein